MSNQRQEKLKTSLSQRRRPVQQRSQQRARQILETTARLLEEVGIDDLTTVLIARNLNISVGSLYHYFPNKHAILYCLGQAWLEQMTIAMNSMESLDIEGLTLAGFVDVAIDGMSKVYRDQAAVLPLAQALWNIPELRELDIQHDQLVIGKLANIFKRLTLTGTRTQLERIGQVYLETTHAVLLALVAQTNLRSRSSLTDLKSMILALLESHRPRSSI